MPLGLILLSRGWISHRELQEALAAQRRSGNGRIGEWLGRLHGVSEETIAKALGIQWNCAVLPTECRAWNLHRRSSQLFCEAIWPCASPSRPGRSFVSGGKRPSEHAAARAIEHMLREPVHAAFLEDSAWHQEQAETADTAELLSPGRDGVVASIGELIERTRPSDARLVRMHDHLWLRIWLPGRASRLMERRDIVISLRGRMGNEALGH